MLIRFKVSNFLSFDSPVELVMTATKEMRHGDRVFRRPPSEEKILQTAVVYGANASGKSNLCKAIAFVQTILLSGTRPDGTLNRVAFKLRSLSSTQPSYFEFEFLVADEDCFKSYRYTLGLDSKQIVYESLIETRATTEKTIFIRKGGINEHQFELTWCEKKSVNDEEQQFAKFVARGTRKNQPFLSEAAYRNITFFSSIFGWFRDQLVVLEPDSEYLSLETLDSNRHELREYIADIMADANTGIIAIDTEPVPVESTGLPPSYRERLSSQLKDRGPGVLIRSTYGQRFSLFMENGELKANKIRTYRKSLDGDFRVAFDVEEESDGTMRLFDLLPLFHELVMRSSKKVYIIDEIDRSLHTGLTKQLLEYFLKTRTDSTQGQLITTVHDTELLDQQFFRRDEVWFTSKSCHGSSQLLRLSDNKDLRHDKDLRRGYIQREFGDFPDIHLRNHPIQQELF